DLAGRRPDHLGQSLRHAPARRVRRQRAPGHAPHPDLRRPAVLGPMATLDEVIVRRISIKLVTPYKVSGQVFDVFDPLVVELRDTDGRTGWGEALISAFYCNETQDGGWAFCNEIAPRLVGL